MHSAIEIARHLVWLGYNPDTPEEGFYFSPLRLQKLLYFCQGWSLALLGRPLFEEPMEAWTNGPVVRSVFKQFKGQSNCIDPIAIGQPVEQITQSERELIESVVERYAAKKTWDLVRLTHQELPWKQAREGLNDQDHSSEPLSEELLQKTYVAKAEALTKSEINNLRNEWSEELTNTSEPADAVFKELLSRC